MSRPTKSPTIATTREYFAAAFAIIACGIVYYAARSYPIDPLSGFAAALAAAGWALTPSVGRQAARLEQQRSAELIERWGAFAVFAAFLAFYAATIFPQAPYDEETRQAWAFLHFHTYIDAPSSFIERAQVGAYSYALHPPLPAVLMIPVVAIWGPSANQTVFSVFVGGFDATLVWILLGRMGLNVNARVWLTVFFGVGTVSWYETVLGTTWALPMTVAVLFTLAALIEMFGEARPLWVGIYAGLAALARYDLAPVGAIYALWLLIKGRSIREILWMAPGFAAVGVFFIWFNEVRYQTLFDIGIEIFKVKDPLPAIGWRYLPGNIYTVLFMAPAISGTFPYLHPVFGGQCIPLTSPAFALAFRPSFRRSLPWLMLAAAIIVSIPSLFYFTNGFAQFGARRYIPAYPFLIVMMALGLRRRRADQLTKILIGISIFLVAFGVWHIHIWGLA